MTKTQKQRDKHIRLALTNACEAIKESVIGFDYLTHTIDLNNEANTLKVQCYFNDDIALESAKPQLNELTNIIKSFSSANSRLENQFTIINNKKLLLCFNYN